MEIEKLIAVFLIGIAASFIGGLTSGGGGLISLPFLIFLGLPPQIAIGTDRFGSFGYVISSIYKFGRSKKIIFTYIIPLIIISVIGAPIGAKLVLDIDKNLLAKIIGAIILLLIPLIIFKRDLGIVKAKRKSTIIILLGFFLYFLSSIYDGFLGAAGGILVAYLFVFIFGLTYTEANATEKIPYFFNAIISVSIFASANLINYQYGLILLAGGLIGAYAGAHVAIKKGDSFVKIAFITVALISAVKLIFFR
ncbi:MAG: sulfite exporter TauE/SafE family protein [Patescibacteria group bacterium]|nr:sulfite exporter TauE/SafE family protein [Patescibacteria group bacterium]